MIIGLNIMMKIKTSVLTYDKVNENGRLYPEEVVRNAIEHAKETKIQLLGYILGFEGNLRYVALRVDDMEMKDNHVIASCTILDTPYGKEVQKIINLVGQDKIKIGAYGTGNINKNNVVDQYYVDGLTVAVDGLQYED